MGSLKKVFKKVAKVATFGLLDDDYDVPEIDIPDPVARPITNEQDKADIELGSEQSRKKKKKGKSSLKIKLNDRASTSVTGGGSGLNVG